MWIHGRASDDYLEDLNHSDVVKAGVEDYGEINKLHPFVKEVVECSVFYSSI